MKTKTKQIFKTAITIPILLMMMLLSFSVHAQTHVYNEVTSSGMFTDPDGALVANPLSDAFNSSANCARSATGGFGKLQIFPTYSPGAADRLYFSVYNPNGASFAQVKFEYTGAPGVWEDGGDVYYGSASTTGWVEYSIGLAPNEGNTINKIILMPSGSSSVAVYVDNIYFHTTSLYPTSGAIHFFKDVVENGLLFHSGAGTFSNPLPSDPINSSASCLRTNGTGAWRETQVFNARYVVKTADKLFISFYNPNNATQWQLRFLFRDGDYLGPADIAHVATSLTGWSEVSVDLTSYIGKEIEKIALFAAHSELEQVYSDNIYIGSTSVIPQQPLVYNETISSGMFIDGDGAQVANPVSDVVNPSANCAKSGTGGWKKIEFFPTYTPVSGSKLYFSVHNPNNAGPGQVKFEYSSAPGTEQWGDNVTYVSGSTTGWIEYSIDLTSHIGNTISKILMYPSGGSSGATYIDNVYFGTTSTTPAPVQPLVYDETISSGMFIDGDGAQVANPVSDVVNPSANCAKSGTGGWKKIEFFPTYTPVSGSKLYFSVHNPNNAGPGQVKFEYSSAPGTEQWGDNVTYVSGSTTGWREYSIDLTSHIGNTISKILMYPSGGSSGATYIDNVYFGTTSTTPAPVQPLVYDETISSGMFIDGDGAQVANPVSDVVNPSANCAKSGTGGWKKIEFFPTYTPVSGSKLYFSVHNPNNAGPGQVKFEYSSAPGTEQWGDNVTYVSGSTTGWREYSIDLTSHIGNTISKILMYPSGGSSGATYIDNVYFGTTSTTPAPVQPLVYDETISSGQFFESPNGAIVPNPVSDSVNSSANCAYSGTIDNFPWLEIQYFPTYTPVSGDKLYFSIYNPNGASGAQVQFNSGTYFGGNVSYVSGSATGWVEYSITLDDEIGNSLTKITLYPDSGNPVGVYIDNIYFGTTSILPPAPQEPIVYNETISSGMFIDGDGAQVANPVKDLVNFSANCAKSGTGGWKKIEFFPTYTAVSGSKLYFSVHNLNNAGPGQVKFEYSSAPGTEQWGGNVDYISSSTTGWSEYSIDLTSHIGNTISKILMYPSGGSSTAAYIDNVYFGTSSIIPQASAFCKGSATVAIAKGTTDLQLYTSLTATASSEATVLTSKVYYATLNGSARTAVTITVNPLPATPASMTTTDAVLCKHIGTTNAVTYSVPAVVGIEEYSWSLPVGVTATSAIDTNTITVNFAGSDLNNISVGGIGTISARAISAQGCLSAPRALVLTSKLPTAPTSLTLTSADTNANFNSGLPSVPTSLSQLSKITKVGAYMDTDIIFTLTAPLDPTAASYAWTLPAGVNQLTGGTSNVITIDFAGVEPGIGILPIVVKSVGGCGQSAARTLSLSRALPTAPTALIITDDAISSTIALTKVSAYTGKTTPLTLRATPARVQGATATSYAWILPAGVNIISPTATATTVYQLVNTGTVEAPVMTSTPFAAWSTGSTSTITVDFADVAPGTLSFPLTVFAVNGTGNSKARTRTVTAAAPTSPAITAVGGTTFNNCNSKTYSVVQTLGTSYAWTVPAGASFVQTGNTIVVNYSDVEALVGATVQVTCTASNGTGTSAPKLLNVKRVVCPVRLSNSSASAFSVKAYPNPSSSEFTIETSAKGAMSVKVYDMQGRLVEKANTNKVGARLAKGVYNVIVNQGANTKSVRVIKN